MSSVGEAHLMLTWLLELQDGYMHTHYCAGYPFDIPGRDSGIFTYCCLAYHLPLSVAFAVREHTNFVWGGCMLLPLSCLRSDRYGILAAWNQVGSACVYFVSASLLAGCIQRPDLRTVRHAPSHYRHTAGHSTITAA